MRHRFQLLIIALSITLTYMAYARVPAALREGRHPNWFSFAIGPSIALLHAPNQLLLVQTFGHHFTHRSGGPAIAIDVQEHLTGGLFVFQTGPRFVYDIRVARGLGFYLSPSIGLEYTLTSIPHHGFSFPFLFKMKLVLGRRGLIFFQPVGIDLMALFRPHRNYTAMQYDLLFGGGVIF